MQRHLWFPLEYSKSHEWKRRQKILEGPQSFQCKALKCKFISTLVSNRDHRSRRLLNETTLIDRIGCIWPKCLPQCQFSKKQNMTKT